MNEKKNFFRKNNIVAAIVALCIATISLLCFVIPAISNMQKYDNSMSALKDTLYDYRIYSPIKSQIDELSKKESIEAIFAYYQYDASVTYNNITYNTNAIFSDNASTLTISAYNEKRLISGSMSAAQNYILLDKTCADTIGAKCGDIVIIKMNKTPEISVMVAGIFKDNSFFEDGSVYLDYSGSTKEKIDECYDKLRLSGALIKEKNSSCLNDIKSYIPLGEMLPENYFSSEIEYNEYVKEYMSRDYSSSIVNKKELCEEMEKTHKRYADRANRNIMTGSIFYGIAFFFLFLQAIAAKKFVEQYVKSNNSQISTNELLRKYIKKDVFAASLSLIVFMTGFIILSQKAVMSSEFINTVILHFGCTALGSLIILMITDIVIIKKSIYKGHSYK